jgi:hypothetical protein
MKPLFTALAFLAFTPFFTSCKKDKTTRKELLTKQAWKVVKDEYKENAAPYQDEYPGWPDCLKDNVLKFFLDYSFNITEGATKCDPADPDFAAAGTWMFTQDETHIQVDGTDEGEVVHLDENTLVLVFTETIGSNTYWYRTTYSH